MRCSESTDTAPTGPMPFQGFILWRLGVVRHFVMQSQVTNSKSSIFFWGETIWKPFLLLLNVLLILQLFSEKLSPENTWFEGVLHTPDLVISKGLHLLFALRLNALFHNGNEWVKLFLCVCVCVYGKNVWIAVHQSVHSGEVSF